MNVNRSGYYKWCSRKNMKNRYESDRELLTSLIKEEHEKHRSYGYHKLATVIRNSTGWIVSDNLVHKCCKYAGIRSSVKHYRWSPRMGEEHKVFKNLVNGRWNATKPMQIVSSDMTVIKHRGRQYEWTYILDTFNNEIISSHISNVPGDRRPYFRCLSDLMQKTKEQKDPTILHTDQGSIYSSKAFFNAHKDCTILRSMSRAGTPTDNPVIESINGWIKAELRTDGWYTRYENVTQMIDDYVKYYNTSRPAYSLQYKTPIQYRIELGFG